MPIATEYDPRLGKFGPTIRQDAGAPPFGAAQYDRRFPAPCHPGPWQHRCARRGDEERRSARRFIRPRRCAEGMARRRVHPADVRSILIIEPSSRWTKLRVNRPRHRSPPPPTNHCDDPPAAGEGVRGRSRDADVRRPKAQGARQRVGREPGSPTVPGRDGEDVIRADRTTQDQARGRSNGPARWESWAIDRGSDGGVISFRPRPGPRRPPGLMHSPLE